MASVREFTLPDLGEGLTEATVVRWLVSVGDVVAVDQSVVEVETAKALVDVPCPYGGVVTARYGDEGTEIPVGAPLLTVAVGAPQDGAPPAAPRTGTDGEADAGAASDAVAGAATANGTGTAHGTGTARGTDRGAGSDRSAGAAAESSGNVLVGYGTAAPAGRRRRARPVDGFRAGSAAASAPSSAPAPAAPPTPRAVRQGPVPVISPLVRRVAREHGLDLRGVTGSGPDGLILRADVERAARSRTAPPAQPAPPAPQAQPQPQAQPAPLPEARPAAPAAHAAQETVTRIPLTGFRRTVADKMSRSRREIPDATCWVDADATELLAARRAMNSPSLEARGAPKVSLLALLARICTAALARFPDLNATVDTEAGEVVRHSAVHLGFAAQTPRGLVVPVVRNAHTLDAVGLSEELARLTGSARDGTLKPGDMTGGTFTLNNYGVFGVDGSTPIINHPEAAMLGVGRIAEKPWVHEGQLAVRRVVQLSFTFDHRVCDGGTAGGFMRHVADCVEQPAVLLRTL
ncbi:dihydrolipoamide acetyltransferase family protein [Streptomyces sp. WMMB 322]|uniref:dihydrolipoamide acetyltransferase family protein n=1 Tax=Streptomyces sp. WMMB 322 TaxID=1286821 RepID=UPI0006E2C523|nr:dihydrolipoamide acetyltransferase family protein [Streptomyces sp. WMMB 322]SCK16290.1 pyruvate dehydrogenase E2 component (dihydrolipoamide acetyltransferase) [Streptomyces sp. WMMB 322]